MGLLFGGKPEEVPLRRKILRALRRSDADFCHMVNLGDGNNDLEEPLSPKEPQEEAIPRGANH